MSDMRISSSALAVPMMVTVPSAFVAPHVEHGAAARPSGITSRTRPVVVSASPGHTTFTRRTSSVPPCCQPAPKRASERRRRSRPTSSPARRCRGSRAPAPSRVGVVVAARARERLAHREGDGARARRETLAGAGRAASKRRSPRRLALLVDDHRGLAGIARRGSSGACGCAAASGRRRRSTAPRPRRSRDCACGSARRP